MNRCPRILPFTPKPEPQPTNEAEARALDERRMQRRAAYAKHSTRLLAFEPPEPLPDFDEDGNPIVWLADASLQGFLFADALRRVRQAAAAKEAEHDGKAEHEEPVSEAPRLTPDQVLKARSRFSREQQEVWFRFTHDRKYGGIIFRSLPPEEQKRRWQRLHDAMRELGKDILPPELLGEGLRWFRPRNQ